MRGGRNVTHTERERERDVCVGGRIRAGRFEEVISTINSHLPLPLSFLEHNHNTGGRERDKHLPKSQSLDHTPQLVLPLTLGSVLSLFFHLFLLR